jgi:hypothetical protein
MIMNTPKPVIFLTFANDKIDDAQYLRNLPTELRRIRKALEPAISSGLCEVVERTAATIGEIFDVFQSRQYGDRIAIFHYGGHADGKQLLLENLEGGYGFSHSEGLVPFFARQKGLQMVFINGCSSEEQAQEMIDAGIPLVVGTSTSISDQVATSLSTRFYQGLAGGDTLEQAWDKAIDEIKTTHGSNKDQLYRGQRNLKRDSTALPWRLFIRPGSEIVKNWNLPEAANDPFFGLPELPPGNLPEEPFVFLQHYTPDHAELFFGRGRDTRLLYHRITDRRAAPVVLFYGQSGAGKSSLLFSGLLPRLQNESDPAQQTEVVYVRRDPQLGLLGTLDQALGGGPFRSELEATADEGPNAPEIAQKIALLERLQATAEEPAADLLGQTIAYYQKKLAKAAAIQRIPSRLEQWKAKEQSSGKALLIIVDQLEEVFTRGGEADELPHFLRELNEIFRQVDRRPKGKIILAYRKEFHPEIEQLCKDIQLPREGVFLRHLDRDNIMEIVNGLQAGGRLLQKYHVQVEAGLDVLIADDLLEDKESPIAPTLQILLTKLWQQVKGEEEEKRMFRQEDYIRLKKQGLLLKDFFEQQMQALGRINQAWQDSGLALDLLYFHVTQAGTSGAQAKEDITARYSHIEEIDALLTGLKTVSLLSAPKKKTTALMHDTLAQPITEAFMRSGQPGQIAARILFNRQDSLHDPSVWLNAYDLKQVLAGQNGMRAWTEAERKLIERSRAKSLVTQAMNLIEEDNNAALDLAAEAWNIQYSPEAARALAAAFYKCFDEDGLIISGSAKKTR